MIDYKFISINRGTAVKVVVRFYSGDISAQTEGVYDDVSGSLVPTPVTRYRRSKVIAEKTVNFDSSATDDDIMKIVNNKLSDFKMIPIYQQKPSILSDALNAKVLAS